MDIQDAKVLSETFGTGTVTEQSETTVTVDFNGEVKKFLYPSVFAEYLVAENPATQAAIQSEIASIKAAEARQKRVERHREMFMVERQRAEARKSKQK